MLPASQARRGEEKLRTVLGQLALVRFRLNSLAFQMGVFSSLALIIAAAVIIFFAAWSLGSTGFLIIGVAVVLAAVVAGACAIHAACRMHASPERAAVLADDRAALKGRLETLLALEKANLRPPLWTYLVEDAMQRRADYVPARIERRRVSRSIYGLLAACILALLATPLALRAHRGMTRIAKSNQPLTLNLRDLTIEPGSGAGQQGSSITGDPATMRKLQRMVEQAERNARNRNQLEKMMKSARNFAGKLQDKITGRHMEHPGKIRLTDNGQDSRTKSSSGSRSNNSATQPQGSNANDKSAGGSQIAGSNSNRTNSGKETSQGPNQPNQNPGALAMQGPLGGQTQMLPSVGGGTGADSSADLHSSNRQSGSSSHGAGSDPNGLFGQPDRNVSSDGSYQIAISARPTSTGNGAGNGAYPPKVNATLNRQQHSDEPISRAAVPAGDRATIKRIFER